ncbi:ABC transporter permease [Uliginosibacterium gangwonense]|uniref:ABC transporter permease n=1 Tax=Uliginosibacterium gangwonense TaxID=392736 RepID=UPI000370E93F|nr:ABC transporter permease [Uliginosibacterium gangwonense]
MLFALIRKELLALLRDPHGMAALFLMPMAFIVIMSLALQDYYSPKNRQLEYAVQDQDQGPQAKALLAQWQHLHNAATASPADWREALRAGRLRYVLVIDKGFSEAMSTPNAPRSIKVHLYAEPGLEHALFRSTEAELAAAVGMQRSNALQERFMGISSPPGQDIPAMVSAERIGAGTHPTSVQQNVPAWLVFGMFFVVTAISTLFVQEQRDGTLARLHAIGVPAGKQILGKALPYLLVNAIQAVLMLSVGVWLMPHLGGEALSLAGIHWPALILVLTSTSLAAIGFALMLACLVRTHAQASTLGPMCNILMAAIGGVMVPSFVMPAIMQTAAHFSPMNWALEGLLQVLLRGGDLAAVLPYATRLAGFALLMGMTAVLLFHRRVKS